MIELRWLKGDWEFGKFKLQYRQPPIAGINNWGSGTPWADVPVIEYKPENSLENDLLKEISDWDVSKADKKSLARKLVKIASRYFPV